jgi:hypothetical protein
MKELNSAYAFYYSELWTFVGKSEVGTLSLREGKGEYTAKKKKKKTARKKNCFAKLSLPISISVWFRSFLPLVFDFFSSVFSS